MKPDEVDRDVVHTLARVAGITIPEEDVEPLIGALRNHLEGIASLEELDVDEADPIVTFDPRWR